MALQLRQALALVWVPQDDPVIPAARENLAVERKGDRPDTIAAIFSNVREHICNGRLRLSPESTPLPVTGVNTQRFAKAAHLCPVRVWRHLPSDTFHTLIVLSSDPLTSCPATLGLNWTQLTYELPFSQMSDF